MSSVGAYYFIMADHRRVDIIKCRPFQPTIIDHDSFASYMWIQSMQGCFVLSQQFTEGRAEGWKAILEVEPDRENPDFFDTAGDLLVQQFEPSG